jgi:hypothetical protein
LKLRLSPPESSPSSSSPPSFIRIDPSQLPTQDGPVSIEFSPEVFFQYSVISFGHGKLR